MSTPPFIDTVHAAELLQIAQDGVLDLVRDGTLKTYGGRVSNPFVRSADVMALASERGVTDTGTERKRVKSPSARIRTRLTADARWSDVSEDDIRDWAKRTDPAGKQAGRKAALMARERLDTLLRVLAEVEPE